MSAESFSTRGWEAESPGKPTLELCSFLMLKNGEKALASTAVVFPVSVPLKQGRRRAVNCVLGEDG